VFLCFVFKIIPIELHWIIRGGSFSQKDRGVLDETEALNPPLQLKPCPSHLQPVSVGKGSISWGQCWQTNVRAVRLCYFSIMLRCSVELNFHHGRACRRGCLGESVDVLCAIRQPI